MATPYKNIVRRIVDGTPTNAATTNQPVDDLAQRTDHLKELLDSVDAGAILRVNDAPLQAAVILATPVYLAADGVYKPAQALLSDNAAGSIAAVTGFVAGVVIGLSTSTSGTLALVGLIPAALISTSAWASVMEGGVFAPGHYYLSSETAGKITQDPGALAIYVGQALPDGSFHVAPVAPVFGSHTHYRFELAGTPAGTVVDPSVGNPHSVSVPNPAVRGWLPATATYFPAYTIPAGASFGYNLAHASEADLRAVFPPIPLDGVDLVQESLTVPGGRYQVTETGIWWMTNAYGLVPWPTDYAISAQADLLTFWFSRLRFATANGVVTKIENHAQTLLPIDIVNASGVASSTGRLFLRVSSLLPNDNDTDGGELALKLVAAGKHSRGPVVARLKPGPGVAISGSHGTVADGFYGTLTIGLGNSDALQGFAQMANLNNARHDWIDDVQMVTLPAGRTSGPVFVLEVSRLAPATSNVRLRPWLYSSITGAVPAGVTVQYRVVTPSTGNAALPSGFTTLTTLAGRGVGAGQAAEFDVAPDILNVPAGSTILIKVNRVTGDGFAGNLGIIRLGFNLI
jgi:hypothetical protein